MKVKLYQRWYIRHRLLIHLAYLGFVGVLAGWLLAIAFVGSRL